MKTVNERRKNMNKSILRIARTIENAPKQRWNEPLQSFPKYQVALANSHKEPEPKASKYKAEAKKHLAQFLTQVEKIESILPRNEHITKGFNLKNQKKLSQFLNYYETANYILEELEELEAVEQAEHPRGLKAWLNSSKGRTTFDSTLEITNENPKPE
jgi:hypothetical protein